MTLWFAFAVMTALAAIGIVWPLWRKHDAHRSGSDVVVYLTPVMAHAVGVSHRKIRIGSPDNNGDRRFTRTFVKHGGEWRILSHQYLTVATSAPR